ncbi:MAG: hypothetical protein ACOYBB_04365 [Blautia sp.]|jgi:hypothetical protein
MRNHLAGSCGVFYGLEEASFFGELPSLTDCTFEYIDIIKGEITCFYDNQMSVTWTDEVIQWKKNRSKKQ